MYTEYEMSFWVDAISHFSVNEILSVLLTHHSVKNTHKANKCFLILASLLMFLLWPPGLEKGRTVDLCQ